MKLKNEEIGIDGEFNHLESIVPEEVTKQPATVMTMETTVENKPQALRKIRKLESAILHIPVFLKAESQIVLQSLLACFEQQKSIQEGLIGDVLWGFTQAGIPPECSLVGLHELQKLGYIKFQAPDNTYIDMSSDQMEKAWVRYQTKLLDIIYEDTSLK